MIDEPNVAMWLITSWYLAFTALFFAAMLGLNTEARLNALARGCVIGGVIASLAAIIGYSRVISSLNELLLLYDRSRGTFKDPNVLGAFLILPALFCLQSVVSDKFLKSFRNTIAFGIRNVRAMGTTSITCLTRSASPR